MNLNERMNLFFYKNQCIKVIITDENKRVKTHIVKIEDRKMFSINKRTYVIDILSVFYSGSLPTYFYYINSPNSVSVRELKKHNDPLSVEEASRKIDISSSDLNTAINETISSKIIRYSEDGDKKIINTIYIMGGLGIFATLGSAYFLYTAIEKINTFIEEYGHLLPVIRDAVINIIGN